MRQGCQIIQYFLIALLSVGSVLSSGLLAVLLAEPLKWLSTIRHPGEWVTLAVTIRPVALWLILFVVLSSACLIVIQRKLSRSADLPYWVGIMAGLYAAPVYYFALWW